MRWELLLLLLLSFSSFGQKQLEAQFITEKIDIDGNLTESVWSAQPELHPFIQIKPEPGKASKSNTSVQLRYDQDAIYFAFFCQDHPDSISKVLSLRDDYNPNCDIIGIFLDTYNDNKLAYQFFINPFGVQADAIENEITKMESEPVSGRLFVQDQHGKMYELFNGKPKQFFASRTQVKQRLNCLLTVQKPIYLCLHQTSN